MSNTTQEIQTATVGLVGKLGSDPELRFSQNGKAYARAKLAVETPIVPGDWKGEKRSDWYDIVCFGATAEHLAESLRKGDRAVVVGRAEVEEWTGKDGAQHTTSKIIADGLGPDLRFVTATLARSPHAGSDSRG